MLGRELINKRDTDISVEIGKPISNERLKRFASDEDMLAFLRLRTFILRYRANAPWVKTPKKKAWSIPEREPIAEPGQVDKIADEIAALPENNLLIENETHSVYFASAQQIPIALDEIGRLRELTFREVNEGTGTARDLDRFDQTYVHLFSWNKEQQKIVGAYRLGHTDEILAREGLNGLYTHTLFRYPMELIEQLGPSLELGRSFVTKEAQRSYASLFLLWRGIGRYVVKHPQYRNLFGPVSISAEYDVISRQLIMSHLKEHNFLPELAKLIKPRNSPRLEILHGIEPDTISTVVTDINDVSDLIGEIESSEKAVPILLRQYLKMGGKMLGFNIDPHFGDVLDGLILVDLLETQPRMLRRYFSAEGARSFRAFHGHTEDEDGFELANSNESKNTFGIGEAKSSRP
jgi:putative hemolysin